MSGGSPSRARGPATRPVRRARASRPARASSTARADRRRRSCSRSTRSSGCSAARRRGSSSSAATSREYAADAIVLEEGTRRHGLFIVRHGAVRVSPRSAPATIVAYLEEGELFGEMSFLENAVASADVIADVPCRIDVVERDAVYALLAGRPGFAGRFFQSLATLLSGRLRRTSALLDAALGLPPAGPAG